LRSHFSPQDHHHYTLKTGCRDVAESRQPGNRRVKVISHFQSALSGHQSVSRIRNLGVLLACLAIVIPPGIAGAQDQPIQNEDGGRNVVEYDAAYFEPYGPISAKDMLARVPGADAILNASETGFGTEQRRGLRSDTDQILINGKRVTAKASSIEEYFDRISASQVIRIEVISGNVREIDADVGARVINVVLDEDTGGGSGTWHIGALAFDTGQKRPSGYLSYSGDSGNWNYTIFGETRPGMPNRDVVDLITTPDGTPTTEFVEKRIVDRQFYIGRGRVAYNWGPDHYIQLNGFIEDKPIGVFESEFTFGFDPAGNRFNTDATLERREGRNRDWEISGDYGKPLSKYLGLEVLFVIRSDLHKRFNDNFRVVGVQENLINGDVEDKLAKETILRTTLDWAVADRQSIEVGVEGAINSLDVYQTIFDVVDGVQVEADIFNSDQKVSEDRVEVFSTYNLKFSDKIEFDTGLAAEFSWLDQVGSDIAVNRSLRFVKPSFDAWYNASQSTQLWFSFKRDVGQLDFEDFVAEVDRNDDEVDLGNPNLDPEASWDFEVGTEHRFANQKGLVNGRVFYRRVNDIKDQVPFGDFESQPGNIGSGDHYGFEIESSLRLAKFNLIDAVLGATFLWQDSSVIDAFTGQSRQFALQGKQKMSVNFRHDISAWGLSYDIEYTNDGPRIRSEFDRLRVGNPRSNLRLIVEKQLSGDIILRFLWNNVLKTTSHRKTTVFSPNQGTGVISSIQNRRTTPMISFGLGLIGKF
jgi:outer membrane receptor for ferrienterochelin and colicins